jgi:uncharacterized protein DUF6157
MKTTNYINTFIAVADDCPVTAGEVPLPKAGKPTVASMQYDMIARHPYKYDSDAVIFHIYAVKNDLTNAELPAEKEKFFAKGQACLRASPLGKRYGWGIHSDNKGRVAIYAIDSPEYKKLLDDKTITQLKAMRTSKK